MNHSNINNQVRTILEDFFKNDNIAKLLDSNSLNQKFLKINHLTQLYTKTYDPEKYREKNELRNKLLSKCKEIDHKYSLRSFYLKSFRHYDFFDTNLDIVIFSDIKIYLKILKENGFLFTFNLAQLREPLKTHYRHPEIPLTLHIHQQVSWNGIIALDKSEIFNAAQTLNIDNIEIKIPNFEHSFLIMAAHCIFENYYLNIGEISYCKHLLSQNIDLIRLAEIAKQNNWEKSFLLFLSLLRSLFTLLGLSDSQLNKYPALPIKDHLHFPYYINYLSLYPGYWDKLKKDLKGNFSNMPRQIFTYFFVGPIWRYGWARLKEFN